MALMLRRGRGSLREDVKGSEVDSPRCPCLVEASPRLPPPQVRAFLQPPMKGVVMETFGSGNGPTKPDLLQELRAAAERGLIIVNCTHCLQGAVTSDYGAGMVGAGGARAWGGGRGEPWPPASFTVHPHPRPSRP